MLYSFSFFHFSVHIDLSIQFVNIYREVFPLGQCTCINNNAWRTQRNINSQFIFFARLFRFSLSSFSFFILCFLSFPLFHLSFGHSDIIQIYDIDTYLYWMTCIKHIPHMCTTVVYPHLNSDKTWNAYMEQHSIYAHFVLLDSLPASRWAGRTYLMACSSYRICM